MSLQKVSLWNEASLCMRRHGFDTGVMSAGVVNYCEKCVVCDRGCVFVGGSVSLQECVPVRGGLLLKDGVYFSGMGGSLQEVYPCGKRHDMGCVLVICC